MHAAGTRMLSELVNKFLSLSRKGERSGTEAGPWKEQGNTHPLKVTLAHSLNARVHITQSDCLLH